MSLPLLPPASSCHYHFQSMFNAEFVANSTLGMLKASCLARYLCYASILNLEEELIMVKVMV